MRKNRNRRAAAGFSLAETLMAVLILLMVSAVVAAGMPMAKNAYDKAIDAANAHTLLSTTVTMLRSELGDATYISGGGVNGEGKSVPIVYRSSRTGVRTTLSNGTETAQGIQCGGAPLVSVAAATSRLHTEFKSIKYENGVYTVKDLCVKRGDTVISSLDITINTVNPERK